MSSGNSTLVSETWTYKILVHSNFAWIRSAFDWWTLKLIKIDQIVLYNVWIIHSIHSDSHPGHNFLRLQVPSDGFDHKYELISIRPMLKYPWGYLKLKINPNMKIAMSSAVHLNLSGSKQEIKIRWDRFSVGHRIWFKTFIEIRYNEVAQGLIASSTIVILWQFMTLKFAWWKAISWYSWNYSFIGSSDKCKDNVLKQ